MDRWRKITADHMLGFLRKEYGDQLKCVAVQTTTLYFRLGKFYWRVRFADDTVDIGYAPQFDRWTNSCDFHAKIPRHLGQWMRLQAKLHAARLASKRSKPGTWL